MTTATAIGHLCDQNSKNAPWLGRVMTTRPTSMTITSLQATRDEKMTNLTPSTARTEKVMVAHQTVATRTVATQTVATVRASLPTLSHRAVPLFTAAKLVKADYKGLVNLKLHRRATISPNTARATTLSRVRVPIRTAFKAVW